VTSSSRARSPTKTPRSNLSRTSAAGTTSITGAHARLGSSDLDLPPVAVGVGVGSDGGLSRNWRHQRLRTHGGWGRKGRMRWAGLGWAELLGLFIGRDASRAIFIHGLASQ
jgi:hypothetical protein